MWQSQVENVYCLIKFSGGWGSLVRLGTSIPCEDLDVVWVYCLVFGCWEHEIQDIGIKDKVIVSVVRI